jgi:hypothetical protein
MVGDNVALAIPFGVIFTLATFGVVYLIDRGREDEDRPRLTKRRHRKWVAGAGFVLFALIVTFLIFRNSPLIAPYFPYLTGLATGALVLSVGAAYRISEIWREPNDTAREYWQERERLDLLEEVELEIGNLLDEDAGANRGGNESEPAPEVDEPASSGDGAVRSPATTGSRGFEPGGGFHRTTTALVLALFLSASAFSGSAAAQADAAKCGDHNITDAREYLDASSSTHKGALKNVLSALSTQPPACLLRKLRSWSIQPWSAAVDAVVQPKVRVAVPQPDIEECGGEASFLSAVAEKCEKRRREAIKKATRTAYAKIKAERQRIFDAANADAGQTCFHAIIRRAAAAPPGTLTLIVSDAIQSNCGNASPNVSLKKGTTILILLPPGNAGNRAMQAMQKRARKLRSEYAGLTVVPSFKATGWGWLTDALAK